MELIVVTLDPVEPESAVRHFVHRALPRTPAVALSGLCWLVTTVAEVLTQQGRWRGALPLAHAACRALANYWRARLRRLDFQYGVQEEQGDDIDGAVESLFELDSPQCFVDIQIGHPGLRLIPGTHGERIEQRPPQQQRMRCGSSDVRKHPGLTSIRRADLIQKRRPGTVAGKPPQAIDGDGCSLALGLWWCGVFDKHVPGQ